MQIEVRTKVALLLALALTLAVVGPVAAQEGEEIGACEGDSVSGTVVAVDDETGEVTIDRGDDLGQCTVTLDDGDYDHPIVDLLGSYFGDVSADGLAEALETTRGYAVYDSETETWTWTDDPDAEGAEPVTVVAYNEEDGTFTILTEDGEEVTVPAADLDEDTADALQEALDELAVDWGLDEDGGVVQTGDEIAAYHEDGLGFGVLVKLYAMADASGVPVDELVAAFQSGTEMGDLFEDYVKPSIRGVGHVRGKGHGPPDHAGPKDRDGQPDDDADEDPEDEDADLLNQAGRPDHAGPKDQHGPPDHAGPKPKKPKKGK